MKLLSWMRTIKQNGLLYPSKEFKGDICCLRAQVSSEVQDIRTNSFSFSFSGQSHDLNPQETDEELRFDEDTFSGFLAIGTLGRDPETPKFAASVAEEDVTGAQKEMAKLITEKLDKFLEESPEDCSIQLVERSSGEGDRERDVCFLQGYDLFQSSTELAKRSNEAKKNKSVLARLFKRRKRVEGECNSMEKHGTRDLIKKVFEKLHGSSSKIRNYDDDVDDDSMPKKKDLRKSAQIFRRKVHPVLYTPAADDDNIDDRRSCINRCDLNVPSSISEANRNIENWIKTDAEYLVLEL
ncbi:unnamed protein product [Microthlaspi erraticum]|uniref:Protein LAZY 1 n=1 Tax=Microthlaspi erraticum TaxID=1685480 RepID=A0A6D2JRD3_9BRAS|nr:unnamed protein product [Microthlaspi erraticum]CAA7046522.1 unnamed protein product [Microthlaspi erraticum]